MKNNINKNEKNSKIDDYFKREKSESEDEEDYTKKFSSIISFKNSNLNNSNNLLNYNFHSQLSFGRIENNNTSVLKFNSMSSALSNNNSLLGPGGANFQYQTSNLLNNSRLSGDDSMSAHGHNIYKTSFSELLPHDYIHHFQNYYLMITLAIIVA